MKKPPPITDIYKYPVTGGVALLAVFVTVLDATGRSIEQLVMNVRAFEREPWRLVTSALPHGDALHLIFNVLWLWTLGTILEERFGSFRLFGLILLLAAGSSAAEYAIFIGGIGLSGVVYGLYGALWVLSRADTKLRGVADTRTTQFFVFWFFFCIAATVMDIWPIANVAHGVGALLGVLAGLAITGGLRIARRSAAVRAVSIVGFAAVLGVSVAGAWKLRPRVNFAKNGGADSARLGNEAFDDERYDDAVARYRQAIATSPKIASTWYNLGVALSRKNEFEEAVTAYARAHELAPTEDGFKNALVTTKRYIGYMAQEAGRYEDAARIYEETLTIGGEDALTLYNLGFVYTRLGRKEDALRIAARATALDPTLGEGSGEAPSLPDAGADRDASR